jgi:hypothetical protein
LLITALDIALVALNLVKTFLTSYLNPVRALIEAIIEEIRAIIEEFKEIGLYVTGDWYLFAEPTDLLGGYQEFERRMVARMTDRTDPTRPVAGSTISTLGAFFYTSAEGPDLGSIQSTLDQLRGFFNIKLASKSRLAVPKLQGVRYGNDATDLLTYQTLTNLLRFDATPPNVARVSWKLEAPPGGNPIQAFYQPPPAGFLVTVSTVRDGIPLMYDRPRDKSNKEGKDEDSKQQAREYGPVRDTNGKPIVLHGGADMLVIDDSLFGYNQALDTDGKIKDGKTRVYGVQNPAENTVIPLSGTDSWFLGEGDPEATTTAKNKRAGDEYVYQRTFLVDPVSAGFQWVRGEYSIELNLKDLPLHGPVFRDSGNNTMSVNPDGPADTYYVRVATLASKDFFTSPPKAEWKYDLSAPAATPLATASGQPFKAGLTKLSVSPAMISDFSDPVEVVFPSVNTKPYLDSLRTALAILVLVRADLPVVDDLQQLTLTEKEAAKNHQKLIDEVALKPTGLEPYKGLIQLIYDDAGSVAGPFRSKWSDPVAFRSSLLNRINTVATMLYERTGPMPDVEAAIASSTEDMRTTTWGAIFQAVGAIPPKTSFTKRSEAIQSRLTELGDMTILASLDTSEVQGEPTNPDTEDELKIGGETDFGVALSPWGMGVGEDVTNELLKAVDSKTGNSLIVTHRKPHFIEWPGAGGNFVPDTAGMPREVPAEEAQEFLDDLHPGLRLFYERHVNADGDIVLDQEEAVYLEEFEAIKKLVGSVDRSPVFYYGRDEMAAIDADDPALLNKVPTVEVAFCRSLLSEHLGGFLVQEAALVLGVAAAGLRPAADGAWFRRRLGDMLPSLEEFLDAILNWIEVVLKSLESAADALIAYIEFVEERIVALQQFLRRINGLIQLGFSFGLTIPQINGLLLFSNGTDGLLADFVAAGNKPVDTAQHYGGGVALVAPAAPGLLVDLIRLALEPPEEGAAMLEELPEDLFGIENLSEEELNPPSDPEPDVL